ncbi:MAG: transporter substrate-binding domain-containing protein [Methylocystaceae bacterium]|nr:transporter substrate-binding domain-containing protein [Methylocystaceae bacterium]
MRIVSLCLTLYVLSMSSLYAEDTKPLLKACSHLGFEPYVIQNGQHLSGIDIDIIQETLKDNQLSFELSALPWARLIEALKNGDCDIGFSLFDRHNRRAYASYIFDVPIHTSNIRVFSLKEHDLHFEKVTDLYGLNIAYNRGFSFTYELEFGVEARKIHRYPYDHPESALKMLKAGRIDLILGNEQRINYYLKKLGWTDTVVSQSIPFMSHEPAFLVISKESRFNENNLHSRLKKSLLKMKKSGRISEINQKYRP